MKKIINKLPEKYKWTIHNLIAHPISEIIHLLGNTNLANKIHDCTIPDEDLNENIDSVMNPKRDD